MQQILAQCNWAAVPMDLTDSVITDLVSLVPTEKIITPAVTELCVTVQQLVQAFGQQEGHGHLASHTMLQMVIGATKGLSPSEISAAMAGMQSGSSTAQRLDTISLPTFASAIFAAAAPSSSNASVALTLLENMNWEWVHSASSRALQLRWLLSFVAVARGLLSIDDIAGLQKLERMLCEMLSSEAGWRMCRPDDTSAEEAHLMCMLEVNMVGGRVLSQGMCVSV